MSFPLIEYSVTNPWSSAFSNTALFVTSIMASKAISQAYNAAHKRAFQTPEGSPPSSKVRLFTIFLASTFTAALSSRFQLYHSSDFINHPLIKKTALVYTGSLLISKLLTFGDLGDLSPWINKIGIGVTWTVSSALLTKAAHTVTTRFLAKEQTSTTPNTICRILFCFMSVIWAHMELEKERK